jgi:hypothetical protein
MDQTRTESLLQTQLRVYREAKQRSLEQLQERQRRASAKAALKRQSIQYERRACCFKVSMPSQCSAKAK